MPGGAAGHSRPGPGRPDGRPVARQRSTGRRVRLLCLVAEYPAVSGRWDGGHTGARLLSGRSRPVAWVSGGRIADRRLLGRKAIASAGFASVDGPRTPGRDRIGSWCHLGVPAKGHRPTAATVGFVLVSAGSRHPAERLHGDGPGHGGSRPDRDGRYVGRASCRRHGTAGVAAAIARLRLALDDAAGRYALVSDHAVVPPA